MKLHWIALVVATRGVAALAQHVHERPRPTATIKLQQVAGAGNAVWMNVNGRGGLFLFDTGEGVSTITPKFARSIGCRPWGQITGFRMTGERLDFPRCDHLRFRRRSLELRIPTAGVFDVMSLLPDSSTELAGSLGLDVFAGRKITIQARAHRILVESRRSFLWRIRRATRIPTRIVRDAEGTALAIDVAVPTRTGTAWMELDTGNGGTMVIGKHIAGVLGLDPTSPGPQLARFHLDGGIPVTGTARVRDLIMDGNIGEQFWSHWDLTLDLSSGRLWVSPAQKAITEVETKVAPTLVK
jgi:hypothetical protein